MQEDQTELEALRLRLEYAETMARQLRRQAEDIAGSRTWRLLTGAGGLWLKLARKGRPPAPSATIPAAEYRRWMADCERREMVVSQEGPCFGVVTEDPRTLASLQAQTYRKWRTGESGDYVLRPAPGDELSPDALYLFAQAACEGADLVYSDEDVLDDEGLRTDPWFKPDWSPDFLAARDYIGRAGAIRRDLGGRSPSAVVHVPRVLYHRRGAAAAPSRRVRYAVPAGLRVEILIPSRNPKLLASCLASIRAGTGYQEYGITVIDNSEGEQVAAVASRHGARHVDWRGRPFNYSAMNNAAAAEATAPLLLFLNDDTTMPDAGWLEAMVEHGARPEIGVVGARLLYPDRRIQHAGVVIGIFGVCGHAFKGHPGDAPTYGGLAEVSRNVCAVTGACMLVPAAVFQEVGGFDERAFPVAYNDIDLCLRVLETGRRVIYTPHAVLYHHEAHSKPWRQRDPSAAEIGAFQSRWMKYIRHDPFYSPNLTRRDESYGLRSREEWT